MNEEYFAVSYSGFQPDPIAMFALEADAKDWVRAHPLIPKFVHRVGVVVSEESS